MTHALVFDSGVGGLSVAAELRGAMPDLHLSYAADDAFRPYGDKSAAQLKARLPALLQNLIGMFGKAAPDAIVLACNTASVTALAEIRAAISMPVIGVVPAIKPAARASQSRAIAVLGTPGTVRRKYVDDLIAQFAGDCSVALHGSVGLVDLAERKLAGEAISIDSVRAEIAPIFAGGVDTVVLACTHFPLLSDELRAAAPHAVNWIDSGAAIARQTQNVLGGIDNKPPVFPQTFFSTGSQIPQARRAALAALGFEKFIALSP